MPCDPLPRLVHIRTAAYPRTRCAACDRRLNRADESCDGEFPISTPVCMVLIRARVCARCLCDPALKHPAGVGHLALAIVRRLAEWYATPLARSALRADANHNHGAEPGRRKRRLRRTAAEEETAKQAGA